MGLFTRKQGAAATAGAMARASSNERERGMDMLQAAERAFVQLGAPSRLGTAMFSGFALGAGFEEESPEWGIAAGASLMGYACRFAGATPEVPYEMADAVQGLLPSARSRDIDYDALASEPARLERLMECVAELADDTSAITALSGESLGAWQAFATTATYQLHRNLLRNGLRKRDLPAGATLESLLRLGYVVRVVDEIVGESPIDRSGERLEDSNDEDNSLGPQVQGAVPAEPLDIETWIHDATSVCRHPFEPYAERTLEMATLELLGILKVVDASMGERPAVELGDELTIALSNARFGYALRNREVQLFDPGDFLAHDDPIAELLDERAAALHRFNIAMVHAILRDTLVFGFSAGRDRLRHATPGTTPEARRDAVEAWVTRYYPGVDPHTGHDVTVDLVEYGYYLHRLFEICPDLLPD